MATRPQLTVVVVATMWGTIGLLVREIELPAVAVAWSRVTIGAAGLGAWTLVRRRRPQHGAPGGSVGPRRASSRPVPTMASGVLLAVHWSAMFAALDRAPIGSVLLIVYLAPVLVALAAPRLLGERVGVRVLAALVPAVVGTALVVGPGAKGADAPAFVLAGVAAITFAAMMLLDKSLLGFERKGPPVSRESRAASPQQAPCLSGRLAYRLGSLAARPEGHEAGGLRLALVKQLTAAVLLAPFAALAPWGPPRVEWWWLAVLGLLHTATGLALFLWALSRMPATEAGILAYLEPAAAVAAGWLVLSERPGPAVVLGGLLIAGAGALVVRGRGTDRSRSVEIARVAG